MVPSTVLAAYGLAGSRPGRMAEAGTKPREEEPKPAHNIEQLRVMTCARGLTFATFKSQ